MADDLFEIECVINILSKLDPNLNIVKVRRKSIRILQHDFSQMHKVIYHLNKACITICLLFSHSDTQISVMC